MKKLIIFLLCVCLSVSVLASCGQATETTTDTTDKGLAENSDFRLTLTCDKSIYTADESITCSAKLEYLGEDETIIYSGDPLVVFSIEGGLFEGSWARSDILMQTGFEPGEIQNIAFQKSGGWGADDPNADYFKSFYSDLDTLILPSGTYKLSAIMEYSTDMDDMLGTLQELIATVTVTVIAGNSTRNLDDAYTELLENLERNGFDVVAEDVGESILQGQRKWLTIDEKENVSIYFYNSHEEMEEDASNIDDGGSRYSNGSHTTLIDWVSLPHFFKRDNIIALYVGEDSNIIDTLTEFFGPEFASYAETTQEVTIEEDIRFAAQYVRDGSCYEGFENPQSMAIKSLDDLEGYYDLYSLSTTGSFSEAASLYDDSFYDEHGLIVIALQEGSGSVSHSVSCVYIKDGLLCVDIERTSPEFCTMDMAFWHIIIEVSKQSLDDRQIEVQLNNIMGDDS